MSEPTYFEQFVGDTPDEVYYTVSGFDGKIVGGPFKTREEARQDMASWRAWDLAGARIVKRTAPHVRGG